MNCVICAREIRYPDPTERRVGRGSRRKTKVTYDPAFLAQHPYCPPPAPCGDQWRNRLPFLFKVDPAAPSADPLDRSAQGAEVLKLAFRAGAFASASDRDLASLSQVSKEIRTFATAHKLGEFHRPATHYDKSTPAGTAIEADEMLEIAILAYHGALELTRQGKPIILYRVADKFALTTAEKMQTLSGRIRVRVPNGTDSKEVWPLEKTAAWIQGALRARSRFLLLSDPRGDLLGGKDGKSDAVYVREIFQILSTGYEIGKAADADRPESMAAKVPKVEPFLLAPKPGTASAPMPLIPRMSREMQLSKAWDGTVSSLALGDSPALIRDVLFGRFLAAGKRLGVENYA